MLLFFYNPLYIVMQTADYCRFFLYFVIVIIFALKQ